MSSSAITTQIAQLKVSNIQNQADSTSIYSNGVWSFKNSTALTSVTITDAGDTRIGTTSSLGAADRLTVVGGNVAVQRTAGIITAIGDNTQQGYAGTLSNHPFLFYSNAAERMRIDASGNLFVTRTGNNPVIVGTSILNTGELILSSANTNNINFYNTTAGAYRFYVNAAGQINATSTSIVAISDSSLKENIRDLETGLSQVLALKPRRFDWKEETQIGQKDVAGFIAQEVEEVLPELVYEYKYNETETKKALKMGDMLPTLVKAIQELSAKNDEQSSRIEALEARLAALEAK